MVAATIAGMWLFCGWLAWGLMTAQSQREFPSFAWSNRWSNLVMGLMHLIMGPMGLFVALLMVKEYGYRGFAWTWREVRAWQIADALDGYTPSNPYLPLEHWKERYK